MNKKVSTISWIWDRYCAKYTEIRKAANSPFIGEIPTKNGYSQIRSSLKYEINQFSSSLKQ